MLLTVGKLEPFKPEEARRVRADGHIVKPFEASELLTAITRLGIAWCRSKLTVALVRCQAWNALATAAARKRKTPTPILAGRAGCVSRAKKKEEPEPEAEDAAAAAPFRDFRKTKGKAAANAPFSVKAPPPPGQDPAWSQHSARITPDD